MGSTIGTHQITIRGLTGAKIADWSSAAARRGMKLRQFIVWAVDFSCILTRALAEAEEPEEEPPARDIAEIERRAREGRR